MMATSLCNKKVFIIIYEIRLKPNLFNFGVFMICRNNSCSTCGTCLSSCGCKTCNNNCAGNYPNPVVANNVNSCNCSNIITNTSAVAGAHLAASGNLSPLQDLPLNLIHTTTNVAFQNQGENTTVIGGLYKIDFAAKISGNTDPVSLGIKIGGTVDPNSIMTANKTGGITHISNTFFASIPDTSYIFVTNTSNGNQNVEMVNVTLVRMS